MWGKKENAARTVENSSYHIRHLSSLQGGKKCALHYLKVLGGRMETSSVMGTNHFALPVRGQCFCSCFFFPEYTALRWLSLEAWWLPVIQLCICHCWENVEEENWAERFPLLRRDLWRMVMFYFGLDWRRSVHLSCRTEQTELCHVWK